MFEPAKNSKAPDCSEALILLGRDGEIRTHDPLHPMQVRYRAALHPDCVASFTNSGNCAWERVSPKGTAKLIFFFQLLCPQSA